MLNKFAELKSTSNQLSAKTAADVLLVLAQLNKSPYYNTAAHGLMDVAYDLHTHGPRDESVLAGHIVSGIAQGLKLQAADAKRYPICPRCGQRHR